MAVRMTNLSKTDVFVWDEDPGKGTDKETRFHYRMLDSYEMSYLKDQITSMEGLPQGKVSKKDAEQLIQSASLRTEVNKVAIQAFRLAVTGIDNLEDDKGKPAKFKQETMNLGRIQRQGVSEDIVRALPSDLFLPFYMQLMGQNAVSEEEAKNSVTE